jgi:hypothetical protein
MQTRIIEVMAAKMPVSATSASAAVEIVNFVFQMPEVQNMPSLIGRNPVKSEN